MRTKTPFRRKRLISRGSSSSTSVEVKVERELQCRSEEHTSELQSQN